MGVLVDLGDYTKRRTMRQRMLVEIDGEILREFKADAVRRGKTLREEVERLMKNYIRRKNASRAKNSGVR